MIQALSFFLLTCYSVSIISCVIRTNHSQLFSKRHYTRTHSAQEQHDAPVRYEYWCKPAKHDLRSQFFFPIRAQTSQKREDDNKERGKNERAQDSHSVTRIPLYKSLHLQASSPGRKKSLDNPEGCTCPPDKLLGQIYQRSGQR